MIEIDPATFTLKGESLAISQQMCLEVIAVQLAARSGLFRGIPRQHPRAPQPIKAFRRGTRKPAVRLHD